MRWLIQALPQAEAAEFALTLYTHTHQQQPLYSVQSGAGVEDGSMANGVNEARGRNEVYTARFDADDDDDARTLCTLSAVTRRSLGGH